ncbi:MAG TPA: MFS transporter [Microbacteriaceae bacterium]|jgi:MFS family permease|nr:MFS transporter [Microbacteriaceae bacterium]HPZ34704.1 MFS transporter [Microbacteriaceae bacterium]HQC92510.1 MFS transporter [Microbacteriaceae bacterium]
MPNQSAMIIALAFAGLTSSFMFTLVVPIQAELPVLLNASRADSAWVITSTLLAAAIIAPISGRLGDMYGKRRIVLVLLGAMVVGSVLAASTSELSLVVIGRTLQGAMSGVIPLGIAIMRDVLHPNRVDTAIAINSATMGVGGSIGMPLSAFVTQLGDWHLLFWLSAALGALCFALVAIFIPPSTLRTEGRFDYVGAALLSLGLVGLLIAISRGNEWGWTSPLTLGLGIAGALVLVLWGWFETRIKEPLLDLRIATRRPVMLTNLIGICMGFAMFAGNVAFPQRLQMSVESGSGFGLSLIVTTLVIAPTGVVMMVVAPISGRLARTMGPRVLMIIGAAAQVAAYGILAISDASVWLIFISSFLVGLGIGFGFAGMPMMIMRSVPQSETGASNGINALFRSFGTSVAAALIAVVLAASATSYNGVQIPSVQGFQMTYILATAVAFVGLVLSIMVPRRSEPVEERHPALPDGV